MLLCILHSSDFLRRSYNFSSIPYVWVDIETDLLLRFHYAIVRSDVSSPQTLLAFPPLYLSGPLNTQYTRPLFWILMLETLYQSICMFFIPYLAYHTSDVGLYELGAVYTTVAVK